MPPFFIATIVLLAWPFVAVLIFAGFSFRRAFIFSVLWGYLFLPENFSLDFSGLPSYDKNTAISLGLLAGYFLYRNKAAAENKVHPLQKKSKWKKIDLIIGGILAVQLIGPIFTYLNNAYPLILDGVFVNAVTSWDVPSGWFTSLVVLVPYFIAAKILNREEDHVEILIILVFTGLFYSLLILFEARMSPQLNIWVYGYFQHDFLQHIRGGKFRPIVFLRHGLWVGFLLFTLLVCSAGLARQKGSKRQVLWFFATLWLCIVLIISRNFGATFLSLLLVPAILFTKPRFQIKLCAIIGILFLLYPAVRQMELVPLDRISAMTSQFSTERTDSFQFRIRNEDALLERSLQKPVFGWGGWGRSRIRDERGRDVTVVDGIWIIVLGSSGWVGYIGFFGIFVLPVILLGLGRKGVGVGAATASLAVIMAGNFIYMVPNSTLSPIGWMMAGAILGYLRTSPVESRNKPSEIDNNSNPRRRSSQFSRPGKPRQKPNRYSRQRP